MKTSGLSKYGHDRLILMFFRIPCPKVHLKNPKYIDSSLLLKMFFQFSKEMQNFLLPVQPNLNVWEKFDAKFEFSGQINRKLSYSFIVYFKIIFLYSSVFDAYFNCVVWINIIMLFQSVVWNTQKLFYISLSFVPKKPEIEKVKTQQFSHQIYQCI